MEQASILRKRWRLVFNAVIILCIASCSNYCKEDLSLKDRIIDGMIRIAKHGDLNNIDFVQRQFPIKIDLEDQPSKGNDFVSSYKFEKLKSSAKHTYLNYFVTTDLTSASTAKNRSIFSIVNVDELVCIHVEDLSQKLKVFGSDWMQTDYGGLRAILHRTLTTKSWLSLLGGQNGACAKIISITQTD